MTGFPDPPKPPLPPPPLPPVSSLINLQHRLKNKLPINVEREQLIYSRFLQNYIFKYNNRNLHKLCQKIDLSNLEYLIWNNESQLRESVNNRRLGLDTRSSLPPLNSDSNKMSRTVLLTTPTTIRANLGGNFSSKIGTISSTRHLNGSNGFINMSESLFDFDEYFSSLVGRMNANPWQFFLDTLLVPTIFLLVLLTAVIIGCLIKSCRSAKKNVSSSSASSSSFIACYGTDSLGSSSVDNSIGVNSTLLLNSNLISSSPKPQTVSKNNSTNFNHRLKAFESNHIYYSNHDPASKSADSKKPPIPDDDDDDEDQCSSGKYYSIKSNHNFNSTNKTTKQMPVYQTTTCLSTFGRDKFVSQQIRTNPGQSKQNNNLILSVSGLKKQPASELVSNSLTNSSSHSVESSSLTRSSNHYNEPDVYFTSSYCRLVGNFETSDGFEKTASRVFPRTNPMYRNYGSTLKLNQSEGELSGSSPYRTQDFIDACSKL